MAPLLLFAVLALPVIVAITLHEAAHGYAAWALGDNTGKRDGRLTLNPFNHIDPWGTVMLPAVLLLTLGIAFGYSTPVPVDATKFKNPKRDMLLVAAAGPMANVALALLLALLLTATRGIAENYPLWRATLHAGIVINFLMVIVNVIPVPPLDAAKAVAAIMPRIFMEPYRRVEPYGYPGIVIFFLMIPFVSPWLGYAIDTSGYIMIRPAYYLANELLGILGAQ